MKTTAASVAAVLALALAGGRGHRGHAQWLPRRHPTPKAPNERRGGQGLELFQLNKRFAWLIQRSDERFGGLAATTTA